MSVHPPATDLPREVAISAPAIEGPLDRTGTGAFQRVRRWYLGHERLVLGIAGIVTFLGAWEIGTRSGALNDLIFSSPSGVFAAMQREFARGDIWTHLGASVLEFTLGFGLAAVVGVAVGLLAGWSRVVRNLLDPWINVLYSTPKVALIPMIILIFGIDLASKIVIVFLLSVFIVMVNTIAGVESTSRSLLDVARAFGASKRTQFSSVVVPGSLPQILTGLRLSGMHGMVGVVVAELVAGNTGIGFAINNAGLYLQTGTVMLYVLFLGAWGVAFGEVMRAIEGRYEVWRPKVSS